MRRQTLLAALAVFSLVPACATSGAGGHEEHVDNDTNAIKVCADGATVRGVDVSYYQGDIDWNRAHDAGVAFAMARTSDGAGFKDPKFAQNWAGMRDAGVIRGTYQFFRPKQDPVAQADLMVQMINDAGGLAEGDLAPMLDLEVMDGVDAGTIMARVQVWLDRVEAQTGRAPMIYTGAYFWTELGEPAGYDRYPLVTANWQTSCPRVPSAWQRWTFWQDADDGHIDGIPATVDTDLFNGSLDDLLAFAGAKAAPPPQAAPTPAPGSCGALAPGEALGADEGKTSCDGRFTLVQQSDGNLVLYQNDAGKALWSTGTNGTDGRVAVMQEDGNLVVYTGEGKPVWDSGTWGNPGAWLAIQDDGNAVIYTSKAIWDSGTAGH
jgi:lysozyme